MAVLALVFFAPVAVLAAVAIVALSGVREPDRLLPAVWTTVLALTAACFAAAVAHALYR